MECQLANITVHYETMGEGKPFVAISGAPGDCRIISSWTEPIFNVRSGWQRFYLDLPGTPRTRGEKWITGSDQVLDVVCDFIDAVIPGQPFVLLGGSLGGYFARGVVYRKSALVEGLCLLAPWLSPYDDSPLPEPVTFVKDAAIISQLLPDDVEFFEDLFVIETQKVLDWYRDVVAPARAGADRGFWEKWRANWEFSFDVEGLLFEKPTLILTGRQDTHVGYLETWDILGSYPRATYVVLDRAGHALGVEQESLFRALFNEWLDRIEEHAANR